jgi:hypothetical protein
MVGEGDVDEWMVSVVEDLDVLEREFPHPY